MGIRTIAELLLAVALISGAVYWLATRTGPADLADRPASAAQSPEPTFSADPAAEPAPRVGDRVEALSAEGWQAATIRRIDGGLAQLDYLRADLADESLDLRLLRRVEAEAPSATTAAPTSKAAEQFLTVPANAIANTTQTVSPPPQEREPQPLSPQSCFSFDERLPFAVLQQPPVDQAGILLAEAARRVFTCERLPADQRADAFAAASLHIARYAPSLSCFNGDVGVVDPHWQAHHDWAQRQTAKGQADNLAWKIESSMGCAEVAPVDRARLYAAVLGVLEQADGGMVKRVHDLANSL